MYFGYIALMTKHIPTSIRKARERVGESQIEFAKRFDVDQSTLSRWETGFILPKGPALRVVKQVLAGLEATDV